MSHDATQAGASIDAQNVTKRRVLYDMPGTERVTVRRDLELRGADGGTLALDLYPPPDVSPGARCPAVVLVGGFPGDGVVKMLGCHFKEMAFTVSWGKLIAASGVAAITYTNNAPAADTRALLTHVRQNAGDLGIDDSRMGLWASSGHAPLALSLLMDDGDTRLRCATLCYPYTLDLGDATGVANASRRFGFVNAAAGKSVADLRRDVPMLFVRAGKDAMPQLNSTLDGFVAAALARDLPLSLVNYANAPHAFDLSLDTEASHEIIRQILRFLSFNLQPFAT